MVQVMWVCRQFATRLKVTEDARDSSCMRTKFVMLASDVLQEFGGEWEIRPVMEEGRVVGTQAILSQEVMPRGGWWQLGI